MKELVAKNDWQLGRCLKMLLDEGIEDPIALRSEVNKRGRMEFHIEVEDEDRFDELEAKYHKLIKRGVGRKKNNVNIQNPEEKT